LELQPVVSSVNQDAASSVESGSDEADKPAFFSDVAEAAAQNSLVLSAVAGTSAQKILASSAAAGSAAQSSAVPAENSTGCVSMTTKLGVLAATADFKVDVSSAAVDWQSVELGRPQEDATSFLLQPHKPKGMFKTGTFNHDTDMHNVVPQEQVSPFSKFFFACFICFSC
jgi:hypothetical protein